MGVLIATGLLIFSFTKKAAAPVTVVTSAGHYTYTCTNGIEFSLTPSEDMKRLTIYPGTNAQFPLATLVYKKTESGERYEGSGVLLVGGSEKVTLTSNDMMYECTPSFSASSTTLNWEDKENVDSSQDTHLAVAELLVGAWEKKNGEKFIREFKSDGTYTDSYINASSTRGTWNLSIKDNSPVIQISDENMVEVVTFKFNTITPEELELTNLINEEVVGFVRK